MRERILIVEDDASLRAGLEDNFELEGMEVQAVETGLAASRLLARDSFDLVILDLMLPGKSGLDVLRELRERDADTPVLILTAKGDVSDKVLGLELGADDYLTKPFSVQELLARVRARLRRSQQQHGRARGQTEEEPKFLIGETEVDLAAFELRREGRSEALSPTEAKMLALLHREEGRVVDRQSFLKVVWGGGMHVSDRTIDTHILNLRKKLERDPKEPRHLVTVHGAGYRLLP